MSFRGSYAPGDVEFLLRPMDLAPTPVELKERLIQSGARHYSEMISAEPAPDADYLELYESALARNGPRLAQDVAALALALAQRPGPEVVLASLARAGTPIGVLLRRALRTLGRPARHVSISIVRGRGIDTAALDAVLERHDAAAVAFVDGWTGKGAIAAELAAEVARYNRLRGVSLDPALAVVADLGGFAGLAATADDYLIPSSVLGAVVSGLVSRTILPRSPGFHGCVFYESLAAHDRSRAFVERLAPLVDAALPRSRAATWGAEARRALRERSEGFVAWALDRFDAGDRNRVKPGLGEATRALLRRVPERVLVRDESGADVRHLTLLAARRAVPVECHPDMPYRAATIIRSLGTDV